MKCAIIQISEAGHSIATRLVSELGGEIVARSAVGALWNDVDAFVFIGAMGICVRTIAPYVSDKHSDPAVVCIDSLGRNAIAVLSGHVGGANELCRRVADLTGASAVITTQSDNAGLWPLDTLAMRFGWQVLGGDNMNDSIFAFVNREPTALLLDADDEGCAHLRRTLPDHVTIVGSTDEVTSDRYRLLIIVSPYSKSYPAGVKVVHYVPQTLAVGFGLAHEAQPADAIYAAMEQIITDSGLLPCAARWYTIDVKKDEPFVRLLHDRGAAVHFFTAADLRLVDVPTPSATVAKHVGTASVAEAAAILGSGGGRLILKKQKGPNYTIAIAIVPIVTIDTIDTIETIEPIGTIDTIGTTAPHPIEIVGAGPGDPELVSVRGRRLLEQADLILYAGSLVPRELTDCHKAGATVVSSASMALEEQCALMKDYYDRGQRIVRLHTGDPCIFGAIQEQMAFFDAHGMHYRITPGISSFLAAAAELRSQFTIPERTQTIILTRGEGRTPMPEREKLHLLARSQSTMCIFLSAAIVDDVQRELLEEYAPTTPVAACYHLTWPDQRIYRGELKDLAKIVHDNHLTLTTMLVVGDAIDNRSGFSALYDKHFTHLYRKGEKE